MALADELATGLVPAGAPELVEAFGLTPARAAGWTLLAFGLLAVVVEPPLLALARGRRARALRTAGLAGMALALALAAAAPSFEVLLVALALYGPASGVGTQLAEAALVASRPGREDEVEARWALAGEIGDLLAPALLAGCVAAGLGLAGALAGVAALCAAQAALAWRAPAAAPEGEDEDEAPALREAVAVVRVSPALLGWSAGAALCALMDELLVALGALWVAARLEASPAERAAVLVALMAGSLAGAGLLARVAGRVRPRVLLACSGAGSALSFLAWLAAPTWQASAAAFALTGLFAAAHFPLLRARAFAALPGRAHVVVAVGALLEPAALLLPLAVGLVADAAGLGPALLLLLLQPAAVLLAAARAAR